MHCMARKKILEMIITSKFPRLKEVFFSKKHMLIAKKQDKNKFST